MRLVLKSLFTPLVAASLTLATGLPALAGDWKPQKPVEMVIMAVLIGLRDCFRASFKRKT